MQNKLICFFLLFICLIGCNKSNSENPGESVLLSFALQSGGATYNAAIDQKKGIATIGGIQYTSSISAVSYKISAGATITPDPQALIGKWIQDQTFTVTSATGEKTVYTIHLKELKEEGNNTLKKVVIGYIPGDDWEYATEFKNIRWDCLTHMNVSFLYVTAEGNVLEGSVKEHLNEILKTAHAHGVKVLISLQSDGNKGFAVAIKDKAIRTKLVDNTIAYARTHQLDGIDIDFEIYDEVGPNLLAFVKELNEKKDKDMLQTCAVANWNAGKGYSTEWHRYFDYINLMAYDFTGGWTKEGQHASFEQTVGLVNLWLTTLQAPASKLVMGLPFYGYSWDDFPGQDDVKALRYHQILERFGQDAAGKDQMGRTYYNGKPTIIRKCNYVEDHGLAGVMLWQIFQDAKEDTNSLLKVVGEEILN